MGSMPKVSSSMLLQQGDFDHVFNDIELHAFLDKVAQHGDGTEELGDLLGDGMALQFLPSSPPNGNQPMALQPVEQLLMGTSQGSSGTSSFDTVPVGTSLNAFGASGPSAADVAAIMRSNSSSPAPSSAHALMGTLPTALTSFKATPPAPPPVAPMPPLPPTLAPFLLQSNTTSTHPPRSAGAVKGGSMQPPPQPEKPQISHSTVEKQRRDRINSLIDELRELVPPQKGTPAAAGKDANSEARRPKHVVLADTIALLKQIHLCKGALASTMMAAAAASSIAQQPSAPPPPVLTSLGERKVSDTTTAINGIASMKVKEEVSPSNSKGSVCSQHEDVEMRDHSRAPQLPHIPMQPNQMAGVVVEKGPQDCMYVQVKCRDRKGLLLDIINSLKALPLEVRTAAVTTTPEGQVRDVFEVRVDDEGVTAEEVQNMVFEALFQQPTSAHELGKRQRA